MAELKGSKTEQNLKDAFAGESQARNKYTYFASVAKKEGYEQIAAIFLETADQEKEHAKLHLKLLEGIGDTVANLKAAAGGENHEWTSMYPGMAKIGTAGGFRGDRPPVRRPGEDREGARRAVQEAAGEPPVRPGLREAPACQMALPELRFHPRGREGVQMCPSEASAGVFRGRRDGFCQRWPEQEWSTDSSVGPQPVEPWAVAASITVREGTKESVTPWSRTWSS